MASETYEKRPSTSSGIEGYLYETKLISLINFRLIHNDRVDQFSLTSNINDAGAFDDICFKALIKKPEPKKKEDPKEDSKGGPKEDSKEDPKEVTVFIQAKHKSNRKLMCASDIDWVKYFESYFKVRSNFNPNSEDMIFKGNFDETECVFVIYTSAKGDSNNKISNVSFFDNLKEFIGTGGSCTQPSYTDEDFNDLCKKIIEKRIELLAKELVKFIYNKSRNSEWRSNEHTTRYHVILAQNVLHVSEIQTEGHRNAKFRPDFFTSKEEFLVLLKNKMSLQVKSRKSEEMNTQHLLSLKLKVPAFFGNKDLTLGDDLETTEEELLQQITLKIIEILKLSNPNKIVAIDEKLEQDFLKYGGVASAVGNLLVFDKSSKHLKFTDNLESLGRLAKRCYESLKSKIENLHEYKFAIKLINFPKLSFEPDEYDLSLVRDFYDKLVFYTNQADQNGVEKILREEIENHPCSDVNNFRDRSHVIFLKYHDEILRLWMTPKARLHLTKQNKIYENSVIDVVSESLTGVLNIMHKTKYKTYTFNKNALDLFKSHDPIIGTVIATESCELTVAKVEQYLGNKDRIVLDLESISKLSFKSYDPLCEELTNTSKEKILIIVCNNIQGFRNSGRELESLAKAVDDKQIIIVTNKTSADIVTAYFSQTRKWDDERITVFTDLSAESQKKLIAASKIKVQGEDVSLDILRDYEFVYIDEYVFNKLINKETIEIGVTDTQKSEYHHQIKPFYIDRRVTRSKNQHNNQPIMFPLLGHRPPLFDREKNQNHHNFLDVKGKVLKTFFDLEDRVVLITGELGMGKSSLLTHLSLKTKELYPEVWILRINLPEHERMVRILNEDKVDDMFWYLCQVALGEEYDERHVKEWGNEGQFKDFRDPLSGKLVKRNWFGSKSKEFQLDIFNSYYNKGKIIFLFDGLDEINITSKWQLETAVSSLKKLVFNISNYHNKVWITNSRYLNIIEQEFGPSYKLENFSPLEQDTHLKTLWKSKIQIKKWFFKKILEESCIAESMHRFLPYSENLRGYALFLEFLKMESSAAGIDFPNENCKNNCKFMARFGLCDSTIPCFPDNTMPWDLTKLAQRFTDALEAVRYDIMPGFAREVLSK